MNFLKKLFRKKSYLGTSAPAQIIKRDDEHSEWLDLIRADVRNLDIPDADQLDHSFQGYLANCHAPLEDMDEEIGNLKLEGREIVQRAVEIAPDLFDKALSRYPLDQDHFIDGDKK